MLPTLLEIPTGKPSANLEKSPGAGHCKVEPQEETGQVSTRAEFEAALEPCKSRKDFLTKCCRSKSQRCLWCICTTLVALLVPAIVLTCVFWPRNPVWSLSGLKPAPGAISTFVAIATGHDLSDTASMAPIIFQAAIDVYNPNFLGAYAKPGYFSILSNNMMLGYGTSDALMVAPRSHFSLVTNVSIAPNPWVMTRLSEALLKGDGKFELPINVFGEADVRVSWINVRAFIMCDVITQALELLKEPIGDGLIKTQECQYFYAAA